MLNRLRTGSTTLAWVAVLSGIVLVGVMDHLTGADVHVTSLYFIPLALAGWRLGRTEAVAASLFSSIVWFVALYTAGSPHGLNVWIANLFTQSTAFLAVSIIVSMLAESLRRERESNRTDYLTGLKNRRAFMELATLSLSLCRRHGRPVSLAFIDLDNFKGVNDKLGHAQGDALLHTCGNLIRECLRTSDVAARFGGDEFAVFLPETDAASASALLERIRNVLAISK